MTIKEFLKDEKILHTNKDISRIGQLVMFRAREKKIRWEKKVEPTEVNDYPESFLPDIKETANNYFQSLKTK